MVNRRSTGGKTLPARRVQFKEAEFALHSRNNLYAADLASRGINATSAYNELRGMLENYDQRNHIVGLEKGLSVIECFDERNKKLTIADVATRLGLSRAAARRCLLTLTHLGYAEYDGKFFRLTVRAMRLGYAYLSSTTVPHILQPYMERLSADTKESCSAAILDDREIVFIARATIKRILSSAVNIGTRLPAYCTSLGRILLAALPEEEALSIINRSDKHRLTSHTLYQAESLIEELQKTRSQGYCVVSEELELGLLSLAVPVINTSGTVVAAMSISTQPHRIPPKRFVKEFLPKLRGVQKTVQGLIV